MNFEALNVLNHLTVSSLSALKWNHNNASNYNDTVVLNSYRGTWRHLYRFIIQSVAHLWRSCLPHCFSKYNKIYHLKFEENMTSSYKYTTHERHNIRFTISRKHASGFTPPVFQDGQFKLFIFGHGFGIIIKEKCCTFQQCIIQQPMMSIYHNITPMTELPMSFLT